MSKKMMGNIIKQAQKLQEEMNRAQEEARKKTITATSGGGMVSVTINGALEVLSIEIEKDVVDPEDIEMLQDLIIAAVNEAIRRAQQMVADEMSKVTGGLQIPGLNLGDIFGA
ncbi:MAG: YbaB/EbfC family nucleoid-associated protein [Nitrospirae bacterium]|nr:MAG: YbaB/EbfC family nucleoid-associated protein [Nitrospirota bacterium]